ncbi:hypothetical protein LCGC14_2804400, partial [marine sediment metagenome]
NLPPAKIYLGDCGSMMIGLTLAVLAMLVSMETTSTVNVSVASMLLFVPILDTTLAIVRRSLGGRRLMDADRGHIHHRLLDRGFSIWQTLLLLGGFCLVTGAIACLAAVTKMELTAWVLLAALTVLAVNRRLLAHEEWKLTKELVAKAATRLLPGTFSAGDVVNLRISTSTTATTLANAVADEVTPKTEPGHDDTGVVAEPDKKAA